MKMSLPIDESLVRILLKDQCPEWVDLPLEVIKSSGTDHALFRLGNDYIVRLPRLARLARQMIENVSLT